MVIAVPWSGGHTSPTLRPLVTLPTGSAGCSLAPLAAACGAQRATFLNAGWLLGLGLPFSLGLGLGVRSPKRRNAAVGLQGRSTKVSSQPARISMQALGKGRVSTAKAVESFAEEMQTLSWELQQALEAGDKKGAARAKGEMRRVQLDKPSAACQLFVQEDCRAAASLIRLGGRAAPSLRAAAVRKLGRWLRWRRNGRNLVPVDTALEGILWALRSEPEVAWVAQCSLFHAARCGDGVAQSVRESTRGTISRLLLNEPNPFPLFLPELTPRAGDVYERAMRTTLVHDFLLQLRALALMDPGYGDDPYAQEMQLLGGFAGILGRSLENLETLKLLGFEDSAMVTFLPRLVLPKLQSLQITGTLQSAEAQEAILSLLIRHGANLAELELNVWTEWLCEADDPIVDVVPMPRVRRLTVRAPLAVSWEHLAQTFPALEELTFLYERDFAINCVEVMDEYHDLLDDPQLLEIQTSETCRDAVGFASHLHARGFKRLAKECRHLREIRFALADTSFCYDDLPSSDGRLALRWKRNFSGQGPIFRREDKANSEVRSTLEARGRPCEDPAFESWGGGPFRVTEEQAAAAGAALMLQVVRLFDDPSLEAQFRLLPS